MGDSLSLASRAKISLLASGIHFALNPDPCAKTQMGTFVSLSLESCEKVMPENLNLKKLEFCHVIFGMEEA